MKKKICHNILLEKKKFKTYRQRNSFILWNIKYASPKNYNK